MAESVTFTLTPDTVEKLVELIAMTCENKSECVRRLIVQEWERTHPQPISISEELERG